jgi:uncharacterized protein YukE
MAGFTGMDIQQVRQLSQQMRTKADEIEQISQQLTAALNGAQWVGPDQARFKSEWESNCVSALRQVCETLRSAGQAAEQNAVQQEQASNA